MTPTLIKTTNPNSDPIANHTVGIASQHAQKGTRPPLSRRAPQRQPTHLRHGHHGASLAMPGTISGVIDRVCLRVTVTVVSSMLSLVHGRVGLGLSDAWGDAYMGLQHWRPMRLWHQASHIWGYRRRRMRVVIRQDSRHCVCCF